MMQAAVHGRLGRDPQERATASGKQMVTASLAVDVTGHNATENETAWFSVLTFGKTAESLLRHAKGDMVSLSGRVTKGRWTSQDGTEREQWTIIADQLVSARSVRPGGRKAKANGSRGDYSSRAQAPTGELPFDDPLSF